MHIAVPEQVASVLADLEKNGFCAYVVGGCVRDSLLGQTPHDWDICTGATPEEILDCFSAERTIPTGLAHGTVTLVREGVPYEITTFRVDGQYSDGRHPDSVQFVRDVREDLARRDFTVNAMAYSPKTGLLDYFGGRADLKKRQIRAVGEPTARFAEDALRILRALRFASVYGFHIEQETAAAVSDMKNSLKNVAIERIFSEFTRLLCGVGVEGVLREFVQVIAVFLPEVSAAVGFTQKGARHIYDVWGHTAAAIGASVPDKSVRLALLFHDLGKPGCPTLGTPGLLDDGHADLGADMCKKALKRLRCDADTTRMAELLVRYHATRLCPVYPPDFPLSAARTLPMEVLEPGLCQARRWLGKLGEERVRLLIAVQRADTQAQDVQSAATRRRQLEIFDYFLQLARTTKQCYCLRDMKVDGKQLMAMGFSPGPELGRTLNLLLEEIVEGHLPNEREALYARARQLHSGSIEL